MSKENQASVTQWAQEMFSDHTLEYRAMMVLEEAIEMCLAVGVSPSEVRYWTDRVILKTKEIAEPEHAKEETGDILSTLYVMASRLGCDVHEELDRKMTLNRSRPKSYYDAKTAAKRAL